MNLPNKITLSRLVLSVVFFVLVSFDDRAALNWAETVFILACVTDYFDGYFARKMNLVTSFGRIADPFVDKVIVCGGFALVAGRTGMAAPSLIMPWMVVVLISREFLVSSIRGHAESQGVAFGAELAGKIKAVVQMFALGFAIYFYAHGDLPFVPHAPAKLITVVFIYAALALTVLSAITYVVKAKGGFAPRPVG